jgi:hypothetical protein
MKEIRKQKKKKKEKKILAERTNPAQPALLTRCPAWQILGAAQPAVSPRVRARPPVSPLSFRFFRTYLHSNTNISRSTTPFSDPFVSARS